MPHAQRPDLTEPSRFSSAIDEIHNETEFILLRYNFSHNMFMGLPSSIIDGVSSLAA